MKESFLKLVFYLENVPQKPLETVRSELVDLINNVDGELQEISVFLSDEIMIQNFGNEWLKYLLELKFYQTTIGKVLFQDQLRHYLAKQNHYMLKYCLILLKKGMLPNYNYSSLLPSKTWNVSISSVYISSQHLPRARLLLFLVLPLIIYVSLILVLESGFILFWKRDMHTMGVA